MHANRSVAAAMLVIVSLAGCHQVARRDSPHGNGHVLAEVTFTSPRNQVLVPLEINGAGPFYFIMDTGANTSVVDLTLASRLDLPLDTAGAGQVGGAGGGPGTRYYPTVLADAVLGGVRLDSLDAVALDMSFLAEGLGHPLHGILGHTFLDGRVVQIDYPLRTFRILARLPGSLPGNRSVQMPLVFRTNDIIPVVTVQVNGRAAQVSLDTGSGRMLEIFTSAVPGLGLDEEYAGGESITLLGARGRFEGRVAVADSLRLGPFLVRDPELTFSQRTPQAEAGRAGNLGGGFLQRFILTLDYVDRQLVISDPGN